MARDDTARDSDSEQSLLDRQSNLRLAQATVATVAETDLSTDESAEVQDGS